jgi:hypothetical protein
MSGSFAHHLFTTPQSYTQLMLQFLEIGNLPLNVGQFFFQSAAHGSARLQAAPSQLQEVANFSQREPQVLDSSNEGQCLHIIFAELTETALRSGWARQERVALVEPNRINAEADLLCDAPNLHRLGSSPKSYTLECSPESRPHSSVERLRVALSERGGHSGKWRYAPANPPNLAIRMVARYREVIERKQILVSGAWFEPTPAAQ